MKLHATCAFFAGIYLFPRASAQAATLDAASCSDTDVQAKVDAAVDGDTVQIPAGMCSWGSGVSWKDKNISVIGAGIGNTVITNVDQAFGIRWSQASKAGWRVSGMTLQSPTEPTTNRAFNLDGSDVNASSYGWRVDHVAMSYPVDGGQDVMLIFGPTWGLIDHISITKPGGTFILIADFTTDDYNSGYEGQYSLSLPTGLGTLDAIFIEDSSFTCTGTGGCAFLDSSSGGQRNVFRHNTGGGGGFLYSHWTRNKEIDGHRYEWYANTMDGGAFGVAGGYPIRIESGTGVIFDNTFTSYASTNVVVDERRGSGEETSGVLAACDGTHAWDGNYGDTNAPGWPCLGQIGRGTGNTTGNLGAQPSVPLLVWNNGADAGCALGGTCTNSYTVGIANSGGPRPDSAYISSTPHTSMGMGQPGYGDVDYCEGPTMPATCGTYTNSYVPAAYPHPLQGDNTGGNGGAGPSSTTSTAASTASGPNGATTGSGGGGGSGSAHNPSGCGCFVADDGVDEHAAWLLAGVAISALIARRKRSQSGRTSESCI